MSDFNQTIIDEFRANEGNVGGYFAEATMLLLHTTGAKSGEERLNPLVCFPEDGGWIIVASAAGAPKHPAWFHNLLAHPDTVIEIGTETIPVHAEVLGDEEHSVVWPRIVSLQAGFADYQARAERRIPLVRLTRR